MNIISMHKAKSTLSQLVKRAASGETIFIGAYGHAQAQLTPVGATSPKKQKKIGLLKGKIKISDDFDAPLPGDIQSGFEGDL